MPVGIALRFDTAGLFVLTLNGTNFLAGFGLLTNTRLLLKRKPRSSRRALNVLAGNVCKDILADVNENKEVLVIFCTINKNLQILETCKLPALVATTFSNSLVGGRLRELRL